VIQDASCAASESRNVIETYQHVDTALKQR
jgi:hypothetical protein